MPIIATSPAKSPEAVNYGVADPSTGDFFNGIGALPLFACAAEGPEST